MTSPLAPGATGAPPGGQAAPEHLAMAAALARLGVSRGWLVDLGALDGVTASTTLPFTEAGWDALLIEEDGGKCDALRRNMARLPNARTLHRKISLEPGMDLDAALEEFGVPERFDLLNLDIDGNDYWVWRALRARPGVVCVEYNPNFGPRERAVIAYDAAHAWAGDSYYGASALALAELGAEKGYRMVGHVPQSALLFVRSDIAAPFAALPVEAVPKQPLHPPSQRRMGAPTAGR